ncbi:MAG TPA: hypothetical protein VGG97_23625 [Bryobacteraceae bacterium]
MFGIVRQYLTDRWSIFIAAASGTFVFLGEALDFGRKLLEIEKLQRENSKLRREAKKDKDTEQNANRLVHPATPEEVKKYGQSYLERKLTAHYKLEAQKERLAARVFIERVQEENENH